MTILSKQRMRILGSILFFFSVVLCFHLSSTINLFAQPVGVTCSNPGFESGDLNCWKKNTDAGLTSTVQSDIISEGKYAALIGDPFTTQKKCAGNLPLGISKISYSFSVPIEQEVFFSFDYRIFSYDEIPEGYEDSFDKFDVYIEDGSQFRFRSLRDGSKDGIPPPGPPLPCDFSVDDSGWKTETWNLGSIRNFDNPNQIYDLRGKTITVTFQVSSQELVGDSGWYNTWVYVDNLKLQPEMALTKSSNPSGPIHENDIISYNISYKNTSLITQTMSITDVIPFNVELLPDSISDPGQLNDSTIVWNVGDVSPGHSGQVSFQVKVPLFLDSKKTAAALEMMTASSSASHILPRSVTCDTTEFWTVGVTPLPQSNSQIIPVQIPPNINPSEIWLLMKHTNNVTPTVAGQPSNLMTINNNSFGASIWTATIPQSALDNGQLTIVTQNPRNLNAIFLFDKGDPPFAKEELDAFQNTTKTFTYTLDIPSVTTQTIDVIIPFMDITYQNDNGQPDNRLTTVTVKYNDHILHPFTVDTPNQGNGLVMAQFPIDIGPISETIVSTATLEVTVDTEDSIYTLG
ncbi:MAG: DUF11 domain-containing protein, partial [Anaerolineae bacterium]|nr:DUF11 domain-containing protein [Anaerolineae bacterium]